MPKHFYLKLTEPQKHALVALLERMVSKKPDCVTDTIVAPSASDIESQLWGLTVKEGDKGVHDMILADANEMDNALRDAQDMIKELQSQAVWPDQLEKSHLQDIKDLLGG